MGIDIYLIALTLTYPIYRLIKLCYLYLFCTRSYRELVFEAPWTIIAYSDSQNEHFIAETTVIQTTFIAMRRFFCNIIVFFIVLNILISGT